MAKTPENNPCDVKEAMAADEGFRGRLSTYKAKINIDNVENGYSRRSNGEMEHQVGTEGSVAYKISGKYTERIHTHPMKSGGAPCFSAGDIRSLFIFLIMEIWKMWRVSAMALLHLMAIIFSILQIKIAISL